MKVSKTCVVALKGFEGLRLEAYRCSAGMWTIGYGHTTGVKQGQRISESQAETLLEGDLLKFEKAVDSLGLRFSQEQFDAVVSFSFNLGIEALKKSTLLKKIRINPQDNTIRSEFMRWVYATGKVLPGLVKRREWEAKRYFGEV